MSSPVPDAAGALPYRDTKPVGAAGFYFGINATARFIRDRLGYEKLIQYWIDLGSEYYKPVGERWRERGMPAVAQYWREFFAAEPGANVEVEELPDHVVVRVERCPLIQHLKDNQRPIVAELCQHCHFVSDAIGRPAGVAARVSGGNGACRQVFSQRATATPQDLREIAPCT